MKSEEIIRDQLCKVGTGPMDVLAEGRYCKCRDISSSWGYHMYGGTMGTLDVTNAAGHVVWSLKQRNYVVISGH